MKRFIITGTMVLTLAAASALAASNSAGTKMIHSKTAAMQGTTSTAAKPAAKTTRKRHRRHHRKHTMKTPTTKKS